MPSVTDVWMAGLTRNRNDAGTNDPITLSINLDGEDVLNSPLFDVASEHFWWTDPQASQAQGLLHEQHPLREFASEALTDSSIRLGVAGDNAWQPEEIFAFGETGRGYVPLAMETKIRRTLSA